MRMKVCVLVTMAALLLSMIHIHPAASVDTELSIVGPNRDTYMAKIAEEFKVYYKAKTGTDLNISYKLLGTEEVLRFVNENKGGGGVYDVWTGGGVAPFITAAQEGYLEPYKTSDWDAIPATVGGINAKDPNGAWVGVMLSGFGIMWNNDKLTQLGIDPPKTWDDLLDPKYFGQIAMANPAKSGSTHMIVEIVLQGKGEEAGWNYFKHLNANIGNYPNSSGTVPELVTKGEFGVGVVIDFYGYENKLKGAPVDFIYPTDGTYVNPDSAAILKGTKHLDAAKMFMDWTMSKDGQTFWSKTFARPCLRTDVEAVPFRVDMTQLSVIKYDPNLHASRNDKVNDTFINTIIATHDEAVAAGKAMADAQNAIQKGKEANMDINDATKKLDEAKADLTKGDYAGAKTKAEESITLIKEKSYTIYYLIAALIIAVIAYVFWKSRKK
jgi:iron(III) transport system substrate-binding protein